MRQLRQVKCFSKKYVIIMMQLCHCKKSSMSKFSERLKELRLENSLTQEQLAKETGLSRSAIEYWELNKRVPSLDAAIVLADFFKVSIDYLAGRED